MKLIPRTHFDNLRLNDDHEYDTDNCSGKRVVKIYAEGRLIAKKITLVTKHKTKNRFFGVAGYDAYLSGELANE